MDKVRTTFDEWAKIGRSELMEKQNKSGIIVIAKNGNVNLELCSLLEKNN